MCPQAANHCALFWAWDWTLKFLVKIQTIWHSDSHTVAEKKIEKKSVDDNKSMKNYPACKFYSLQRMIALIFWKLHFHIFSLCLVSFLLLLTTYGLWKIVISMMHFMFVLSNNLIFFTEKILVWVSHWIYPSMIVFRNRRRFFSFMKIFFL